MKKILMVAPSSYPVIGAEAIVNIKLLKVLSDSEQFCIDLISRQFKWANYPSDSFDNYNIKLNSLTKIEVDNVINAKTILQNLLTFMKFGILSRGYHWAYPAWKVVKQYIKNNEYDYVLTKDIPSLLIGYQLKKQYGIKWVATWNDPCPWVMYPKPYGKGVHADLSFMNKRIIRMMKSADVHIFPNERLCNYMNQYLHISKDKCMIVPHVVIPPKQKEEHIYSSTLRIIHSGNLDNPRNPETFLKAFRMFIDKNPNAQISFTIMGKCDSNAEKLISSIGLEQYVSYISPIEYKNSLRKLSLYDIALIIEANCEEGIFLPTKVSDFMQMSIPIFAISPKSGVLNDLYSEGYIAYFSPVNSIDIIYQQLKKIYNDFVEKNIPQTTNYVPSMTAEAIVEQYLSI